jgi:hypothetical protein
METLLFWQKKKTKKNMASDAQVEVEPAAYPL